MVPVLSYGRAPATRVGAEHVRLIRHPASVRVAVFPPGPYRGDFLPVLLGALLVAAVWAGATALFSFHAVPIARYAGAVWPLAMLLVFFLAMLAAAYDAAFRQVEFEVDDAELVRLSFGPFGVRRQRWDRAFVCGVRVARHVSGSHPRVVLTTGDGRAYDVYCPGASDVLGDDAEQAADHLRQALGFARLEGRRDRLHPWK